VGTPFLVGEGSREGDVPPPEIFSLIFCLAMVHFRGVCKKTTGSTGIRWVGQWVGPKGGIAGVSLSRPLQTTGQHSSVQYFNSQ